MKPNTLREMKKIRATLLRDGDVLVSVTSVMRTDKGHEYASTEHVQISATDAEVLLYDLHGIVQTVRGINKKPSRWHRLTDKIRR